MIDFMEDTIRVVHWYLDPVNHDAGRYDRGQADQAAGGRFAAWIFTDGDYYRDPNMLPNLQALQANIDLQRDVGFLKEPLNIKEFVDLSWSRRPLNVCTDAAIATSVTAAHSRPRERSIDVRIRSRPLAN